MRSRNRSPRDRHAGFTFLEVLISLALTAAVMGAVMVIFSRAATVQAERLYRLWLAEFALSVLEEYKTTFPEMSLSGAAPGGWQWSIVEADVTPNPPGSLDAEMNYVSITATVWQKSRPDQAYAAASLMARRR